MALIHFLGVALALGQVIYGQAHAVVASAPRHPAPVPVRWTLRFREQFLVPVGILALTYLSTPDPREYPYSLGVLGATSVLSLLLAVLLYQGSEAVRDIIRDRMAEHEKLRSEHATLSNEILSENSGEGAEPRTDSGSITLDEAGETTQVRQVRTTAASEVRQQKQITLSLWDLPVALVHVDLHCRVKTVVGGATRMSAFPDLAVGDELPTGSTLDTAVHEVIRNPHRHPFEIRTKGRVFTAVASPWVTMSGRMQGVAVLILSADEVTQTDEGDVIPFRVAHG